jgi:BASS family bile acid:Na+ symporter
MTTDGLISALVSLTCIEMMVTVGLGARLADLGRVAQDHRLVARVLLATYLAVPLTTIGLLSLLHPHPMVAAGFVILAVRPGAPFGPPIAAVARGNVADSAALMVLLAGSSAVLAPCLLPVLLPLVASGESVRVDPRRIVGTLLMVQIVPLAWDFSSSNTAPSLR